MSAVSGNVAANKVHALLFVFYHVPFVFMCIYFSGICTQTYYWSGIGKREAISIKTVRKNLWFICLSQLRFLMLQLFRWTQNWQDLFFFSCHLHLCSWHHSYWSKSVSISAVFCCNAFQISWCFKYFFFNLASKHMEHLWSPGIIQIWSTLGFLSHTLQSDAFEALGKIWDICINYFITPKIYVVIYSQN